MTHDILVDSIMFARGSLICEVMSRAVDAEYKAFLERPSSEIKRKSFISRLRAAKNKMSWRRCKNEKIARRTKEAIYLHTHRKKAQCHRPRSPAHCYRASGNQLRYPTNCLPTVPPHRAPQLRTGLRHPSRNQYRMQSSQPAHEEWGPIEGC